MKNVLIVSPFFPLPLISGGHQAIFNGIACLEGVANVFLVYTTTESKFKKVEKKAIREKLPFVKCVPYINPLSRHNMAWVYKCVLNKLKDSCFVSWILPKQSEAKLVNTKKNGVPNIEIALLSEGFQKHVLSLIKKYQIDIVQMEMIETIRLVDVLPVEIRKVFVHHEIRWVRNDLLIGRVDVSEDTRKRVVELKQEEIGYLNRCDRIIVLSETDKKKLQQEGVKTEILTSFAVVNGKVCSFVAQAENSHQLSYVGPSDHYPNYDGVMWFLRNCWHRLLDVSPEFELQIIGRWDEFIMNEIMNKYKNVRFLGFVEDLGQVLQGSIEIVPLNIGSGIRMKILEAARLGVPVVSTSVGAEGLPLMDGKDILIADNAADFVGAICKLQDWELRKRLVTSMQQNILPMYSIEALENNRKPVYE